MNRRSERVGFSGENHNKHGGRLTGTSCRGFGTVVQGEKRKELPWYWYRVAEGVRV